MKTLLGVFVAAILAASYLVAGQAATVPLTLNSVSELKQRAAFIENGGFKFALGALTPPTVDNAAVTQRQMFVDTNPFLATLPAPGISTNLLQLKPCGILLSHVHPRATEIVLSLDSTLSTTIVEENGGRNISFSIGPYELFVAPMGLVHHVQNKGCTATTAIQMFNHHDPGNLNIVGALARIDPEALAASSASIIPSPQGAFALDQACLRRCGLPSTGGAGGGTSGAPSGTPFTPNAPGPALPTLAGVPITGRKTM